MAAEKKLDFEKIPIDNDNFFITDVPKDIVDAMAELIYPAVQKYFEKENIK